jgi:hypothetical protein
MGSVRFRVRVGALVLFASVSNTARAQDAPAAQAAPAAPRIAVAADAYPQETDNALLGAAVYETGRSRGLVAVPPPAVAEAAQREVAYQAGALSVDVQVLERIRIDVNAAVLVRIARTPGGEVNITVVGGANSPQIHVVALDRTAINTLVDQMLASAGFGGPARPAEAQPSGGSPSQEPAPSYLVLPGHSAVPPDKSPPERDAEVRAAWVDRGGLRFGWDVRGMITAMHQPEVSVPKGATSGVEKQYGIGGGLGVHIEAVYLNLPDPSLGGGFWAGFRLGAGLDGHLLYSRKPTGYKGVDVRYDDVFLLYPVASAHAGLYLAFGSFPGPTIWRGVVLGLAYAPAFEGGIEIGDRHFAHAFNPAGFEASIDVKRIDVADHAAAAPQIRLVAHLLPPVRDELPWLISAGVGAAAF